MIYSPHAVGRDQDGTLICIACDAAIDLATGKCEDAQAIDRWLATAVDEALDRVSQRFREEAALQGRTESFW